MPLCQCIFKICKVQKDLKFYVRTRACEKRESGKQPLSPFSTRRICSRDAKRKQEFSNVIGWRESSLLCQPITLPDSCFRFASREQIRLVKNGLKGLYNRWLRRVTCIHYMYEIGSTFAVNRFELV